MLIVPDANIIIRDYHLKGAAFRSLLDSARSVGAQLCVPRCVLDEAQEHFEQDLRRAADQLDNAAKSLGRLLEETLNQPAAIKDFSGEASKYRAGLEKKIKDSGGTILDYPDFLAEEVIQRAVKHRKPFASKGDQGFKDYLIWKSILNLAKQTKAPIKLVSTNKTDFGDSVGGLHPDLLEDLETVGVPRERIAFVESLDMILTGSVMPALQELKEIAERLKSETFDGLSVSRWIFDNLAEGLDINEVLDLRWALKREFETPTINAITSVMRDSSMSADCRRASSSSRSRQMSRQKSASSFTEATTMRWRTKRRGPPTVPCTAQRTLRWSFTCS